jgi:hypothetical protein
MHLRTTNPPGRVNNDLQLTPEQWQILNHNQKIFKLSDFQDPKILGGNNNWINDNNFDWLRQSLVYVVTETVGDYPYPYFSEKTWRGINIGVPFMLVGARYSLKKLQEFGFKTFSNWWSEDYDNHAWAGDRICAITQELVQLQQLDFSTLQEIRNQMELILKFNQQHLLDFRQQDLDNLRSL